VSRRIAEYLYSWKNIAGCVLALVGLGLHFSGLIDGLQWLPITVGLYLIGALLVPGEKQVGLDLDQAASPSDVRKALDNLLSSIQGRVPADIYARVASIQSSILVTLGNGNGGGANAAANSMVSDPNVYLIRQTALSYLPEALNGYLALPSMYRDRSLAGHKSAHDTLLDQLNLMDQKMHEVADAMVAHDTDRLEAHGRFLAEKFGGSSLDLGSRPALASGSASGSASGVVGSANPDPAADEEPTTKPARS
jgi:hypothetical protein